MHSFPFTRTTLDVEVKAKDHRQWWTSQNRYPIQVTLQGVQASVGASHYRLTPHREGYICTRPQGVVAAGEIYEYGVRQPLTTAFFHELSAVRAAIYGKSCPSPLCYEMPNGDLVHPGPCFTKHPSTLIRKTRYTLTEEADHLCAICHERFL